MSGEENARAQDVGRSHHRRAPGIAPASADVLERYRAAMRAELETLLEAIGARRVGLLPDAPGELVIPLPERARLWDLAIKLGRELAAPGPGGDPDPGPADDPGPATRSRRRDQAPRLSARERRALGG